jgi:HlyD family secretion protein
MVSAMDFQRPGNKSAKRRRLAFIGVVVLLGCAGITQGLSWLKPSAPGVELSTIWTDTVKSGSIVRQVRGLGTLVPVDIRWIPAETEGRVERICVLPGTPVKSGTVILELSNPQTVQESVDADWQVKAAEAEYKNLRVKIESDLMNLRASAATIDSEYGSASRQARTDEALAKLGVISGLTLDASRDRAKELETRREIEAKRIEINTAATASQMAVLEAKVEQFRAFSQLKRRQLDSLRVYAKIDGVLQELPLEVGQRVTPGMTLAKVVQPEHLKAELKIPEIQAKDVQVGQPATVDTHNGIIAGTVSRVEPAVQNGTVTIDVKFEGTLPKGARPDLSVEGVIDLEHLTDVLFTGRPVFGGERSTVGMFRLEPGGKTAVRVPVKLGRASVNVIEVLDGLKQGDQVILSDMSRWNNFNRIRLE